MNERGGTIGGDAGGFCRGEFGGEYSGADDTFHDQHTFTAKLIHDVGREDSVGRWIKSVEILLVAGFVVEIEFMEQVGLHLIDDGGQVVGLESGNALVQLADEPREQVEIGLHGFKEMGSLDFDRDLAAIIELGEIDLCERGAGDGSFIKLRENLSGIERQFFDEHGAHFGEWERADGVLQFAQLIDERVRQRIRPHAHELAGLHKRRAEFFQG